MRKDLIYIFGKYAKKGSSEQMLDEIIKLQAKRKNCIYVIIEWSEIHFLCFFQDGENGRERVCGLDGNRNTATIRKFDVNLYCPWNDHLKSNER